MADQGKSSSQAKNGSNQTQKIVETEKTYKAVYQNHKVKFVTVRNVEGGHYKEAIKKASKLNKPHTLIISFTETNEHEK